MIKEIKNLKCKKTKKLKKYKRKHYKQQRLTKKQSQSQKKSQSQSHIQKQEEVSDSTIGTESKQKGGNVKEKFEVKRLADIDYSQFSLSKYINANTNWGSSPGPPPMDCSIM